jgi:hypothetical protein
VETSRRLARLIVSVHSTRATAGSATACSLLRPRLLPLHNQQPPRFLWAKNAIRTFPASVRTEPIATHPISCSSLHAATSKLHVHPMPSVRSIPAIWLMGSAMARKARLHLAHQLSPQPLHPLHHRHQARPTRLRLEQFLLVENATHQFQISVQMELTAMLSIRC